MRAASDIAQSFGPVDSNIFMESDKPTLFDVATDLYGLPRKPKHLSRAVSLEEEFFRHSHEKMAKSQKASRPSEFSTVRHSPGKERELENRLSDALLLYQGVLPTRLALETYDSFEEGVWFQSRSDSALQSSSTGLAGNHERSGQLVLPLTPVQTTQRNADTWMMLQKHPGNSIFAGTQSQAVKVINLRHAVPPLPSLFGGVPD